MSTVFPSPCGEKVGINRVLCLLLTKFNLTFPSPCGEKVGINGPEAVLRLTQVHRQVSVPLRGKGRDQQVPAPDGSG